MKKIRAVIRLALKVLFVFLLGAIFGSKYGNEKLYQEISAIVLLLLLATATTD